MRDLPTSKGDTMPRSTGFTRPALVAAAIIGMAGTPLAAQTPTNTNTTSTSGVIAQDTMRHDARDNDKGFPWGLLGLLGLAGLLGRRKVETVETVRSVPPTTGRPGDQSARI
jgi:MYXO-CTERM domain-containing protein